VMQTAAVGTPYRSEVPNCSFRYPSRRLPLPRDKSAQIRRVEQRSVFRRMKGLTQSGPAYPNKRCERAGRSGPAAFDVQGLPARPAYPPGWQGSEGGEVMTAKPCG
jgi:hypothetical protein